MKKYKTKRDLPGCKAGTIAEWNDAIRGYNFNGGSLTNSYFYTQNQVDIFTDWFELVEEEWEPKFKPNFTPVTNGIGSGIYASQEAIDSAYDLYQVYKAAARWKHYYNNPGESFSKYQLSKDELELAIENLERKHCKE